MAIKIASAEWRGNLKEGNGSIDAGTGILRNVPYNFVSRFEHGADTSPEELLGAAHAACFSMALANSLSSKGFKVASIKTEDRVHINMVENGFKITTIEVNTEGDVDGIDDSNFTEFAEKAKVDCPVSQALKGVKFILNVKFKN